MTTTEAIQGARPDANGPAVSGEIPSEAAPAPSQESARIADLERELAAANAHLLDQVPAHLRDLVPSNTGTAERIAWINRAKSAGLFAAAVQVPTTDSGRPAVTPRDIDFTKLPPTARMSAGYN